MPTLSRLARGSVLARTASHAADSLQTAFHTSRVGRTIHGVLAPVRSIRERAGGDETELHSARDRTVPRYLRESSLATLGRRTDAHLRTAATGSALRRAADAALAIARDSWLYRWLTAEPDPDVVVIDLRTTVSIGPPLMVIDRIVDAIVPGAEGATVVRAFERVGDALRRRPVAIASAIVLCVVAVGLLLTLLRGDPNRTILLGQLIVAAFAALGLRSRATLADLRETRTARAIVAVLEPPEPPAERADQSPDVDRSTTGGADAEAVARPDTDERPDDEER